MRLGGCVAVELTLGATTAAAVAGAAFWISHDWGSEWARPAYASQTTAVPVPPVALATSSRVEQIHPPPTPLAVAVPEPVVPVVPEGPRFEGRLDREVLASLQTAELTKVSVNRGGTSLSLRLDFADGSRAAFKPQQTHLQTVPRREIAAYRLNRLLGLATVAPAIGRTFPVPVLTRAWRRDHRKHLPRFRSEMKIRGGVVIGGLSSWIPVITRPKIGKFRLDEVNGIVTWRRFLRATVETPPQHRPMLAQISTMIVFDFLINNIDRWSGGNVKASADGSFLYYMDNTFSFGQNPRGHVKVQRYLERVEKFSRSFVSRLRGMSKVDVRTAVGEDLGPYSFLLSAAEVDAVMGRRDAALAYIDGLIASHGADVVLDFP